jgi:hypothetical protein
VAFTIPNTAAAAYAPQAGVDAGDVAIVAAAALRFGVVGGCGVVAQATPNMTVTVGVGIVHFPTFGQVSVSAQTATITAANATNPRHDLVVVNAAGVVSVLAGTPAALTATGEPVYPAAPVNVVVLAAVYVPPAVTAITNAMITDKRMVLPHDQPGQMNRRTAWLWPFTPDSPWNIPIATTAVFQRATDPATASFIATSIPNGTVNAWVTYQDYNMPIFKASYSDPLATMTDTGDSSRSDVFRIPANAAPATGSDHSMGIVTPDGRFLHETWVTIKTSNTVYSTSKHVKSDLYGRGIGPNQGVHASGASIAGGLIREWEIFGGPEGAGEIRHNLCVGLDPGQLYYNSAAGGYTIDGYGRGGATTGYVWPAMEQDFNSPSVYTGQCPMGALAAIPPWVDITTLGLSAPGRAVARALQLYGATVVDMTTLTWSLYADQNIGDLHMSDWLGPVLTDMNAIRAQTRIVANNSRYTPGGGVWTGDASNRVAPIAPPLPAAATGRPT